jgi:mannose-6-phosphate isomerase-like protein (cupin superfamily)
MNRALLGRLGLVFGLDRFILKIRRADDVTSTVHFSQVEGSFRALVGAVFLEFGTAQSHISRGSLTAFRLGQAHRLA